MTTTPDITSVWGEDVEFIGGVDLRDKAELVNVEFLVTAVRFEKNARGVEYAYVTATTRAGETFEFNDSSNSGVRAQLTTYFERKEIAVSYESGEVHEVKILAPRGLRLSTYEVTDLRGKPKMAKTYYLTTGQPA
jgi:hypothetical protein